MSIPHKKYELNFNKIISLIISQKPVIQINLLYIITLMINLRSLTNIEKNFIIDVITN